MRTTFSNKWEKKNRHDTKGEKNINLDVKFEKCFMPLLAVTTKINILLTLSETLVPARNNLIISRWIRNFRNLLHLISCKVSKRTRLCSLVGCEHQTLSECLWALPSTAVFYLVEYWAFCCFPFVGPPLSRLITAFQSCVVLTTHAAPIWWGPPRSFNIINSINSK